MIDSGSISGIALNLFSNLDIEGGAELALDLVSGVFAFVLFAITLFAWRFRGKQPSLLIVALGFLAFFSKQLIQILPLNDWHSDLFKSGMDFLTLGLFFIALVVRPQRRDRIPAREPSTA